MTRITYIFLRKGCGTANSCNKLIWIVGLKIVFRGRQVYLLRPFLIIELVRFEVVSPVNVWALLLVAAAIFLVNECWIFTLLQLGLSRQHLRILWMFIWWHFVWSEMTIGIDDAGLDGIVWYCFRGTLILLVADHILHLLLIVRKAWSFCYRAIIIVWQSVLLLLELGLARHSHEVSTCYRSWFLIINSWAAIFIVAHLKLAGAIGIIWILEVVFEAVLEQKFAPLLINFAVRRIYAMLVFRFVFW